MDDKEFAGVTGNNSLPRGPTPSVGYNALSQEKPWSTHPRNPLAAGIVYLALQGLRLSLAQQLPRVTSHYQSEI